MAQRAIAKLCARACFLPSGAIMKALVKRERAPGLWLEDVPEPKYGINDVLIRVGRTGICGTDVHIYNWDCLGPTHHSRAHGGRPRVRG